MTFCGKDASCYCPRTCVLNSNSRDTNIHAEDETAEETEVSSEACPRSGVPRGHLCRPLTFGHVWPRVLSALPSLTVRWSLVPTDDPNENKQQLAKRESRKPFVLTKWTRREQVCFAGSGCLPLCRLGPRPWALSGPGWCRGGGGGGLRNGCRRRHCRNPAFSRLTSSTRRCGRFFKQRLCTFPGQRAPPPWKTPPLSCPCLP